MTSNIILERVFDFLKDFPPFSLLDSSHLRAISGNVTVRFLEKGEYVFRQGDDPLGEFFIVRQGSVELRQAAGANEGLEEPLNKVVTGKGVLIDVCDEGDVFGVRAMISQLPYISNAIAAEEVLLYGIPTEVFKPLLTDNPQVALFFAAGFAAGQPVVRRNLFDTSRGQRTLGEQARPQFSIFRLGEVFSTQASRPLVSCKPGDTIQRVAELMSREGVGSIVITDDRELPLGIVTDTDFRKKVVTGQVSIHQPVKVIMNSPVVTVSPSLSVAEVLIRMMRHHVHHLCITADGTPDSEATGIISEHDLLLRQGSNPAVILREIEKSNDIKSLPVLRNRAEELLSYYLQQEVNITFVAGVISEINDALIRKALQHAEAILEKAGVPSPGLRYCWLSLGSEGREEQLLRTDQDNALVYEDPAAGKEALASSYFLELASEANKVLIDCGFAECPSDMMARNQRWCQPISQWKDYFGDWIRTPDEKSLMLATIFFDYRPVYGDYRLAGVLTDFIYHQIRQDKVFLNYLAANALQNPPPLGFFRNLLVERSGEHKDSFDIKLRAMMPLVDAARVLILSHEVNGINNTFKRYEKLAELEPKNAELYREAAMAYEIMMRLRAQTGLRLGNSGRYVPIQELSKIVRQTLRHGFQPIADVQEVLRVRFQLDMLRR
jgi:CBS domain-containing protein